jgi:RNA polymerase sigma-70 factor (ECF subfamily)
MQMSAAADAVERDRDILELLSAGRRAEAFDLLLGRYESKIFRLCCSLLRNTAQAEDAAQESLVRVWQGLQGFDGRAALSTWMYTIARNRCFTALERRRDEDSLSDEAVAQAAERATAVPAAEADDHLVLLRELVDALPERYRRTLSLFYYEDRSINEVAAMLGAPEGTVKTTLFRGRALLLQRLTQLGLADAALWLGDGI